MALTVFSDDAHRCATSDRAVTANRILTVAVRDAVRLMRLGRPGQAEFVLTRAGMSADRILGHKRGGS